MGQKKVTYRVFTKGSAHKTEIRADILPLLLFVLMEVQFFNFLLKILTVFPTAESVLTVSTSKGSKCP